MKLFLVTLLSVKCLLSQAQLLNLTSDWFTEEGFFLEESVQKNQIESISISKSNKFDGSYFSTEKEILRYNFNADGKLTQSLKFTSFSNKIDTSIFRFFYDKGNNVFKRVENGGPFSFTYYFVYQNEKLKKEVKIDNNSPSLDTAYIRFFEHEWINENTSKVIHYNSIHRPYQYHETEFDLFGQLVRQKTNLIRSLNYTESRFVYQINQLTEKSFFTSIGKQQNHVWKYSYNSGILDFIEHHENEALIEKIGFTYHSNGLVSAIVTRDLNNKSVAIYRLTYTFFN